MVPYTIIYLINNVHAWASEINACKADERKCDQHQRDLDRNIGGIFEWGDLLPEFMNDQS